MIDDKVKRKGRIRAYVLASTEKATAVLRYRMKLCRIAAKSTLLLTFLLPTLAFGYPFKLSWNDVNGDEDGTVIYREISGEYQEVGIVGSNVTTFTDDPPGSDGDTFCWTVRAFRDGAFSESSNETCGSVPETAEPQETRPGARKGWSK